MKTKLIALFMMALLAILPGCQKAPINKTIEGHWRVNTITRSDGTVEHHHDMFYTLKLWVVETADKSASENRHNPLIGRLEFVDDTTLRMYEFKGRFSTGDNKIDATPEELAYYGLESDNTVKVIESTGSHLTLQTPLALITMTRF